MGHYTGDADVVRFVCLDRNPIYKWLLVLWDVIVGVLIMSGLCQISFIPIVFGRVYDVCEQWP